MLCYCLQDTYTQKKLREKEACLLEAKKRPLEALKKAWGFLLEHCRTPFAQSASVVQKAQINVIWMNDSMPIAQNDVC
jgi:hypothetical protein